MVQPLGGKWTFDEDNRKKNPKGPQITQRIQVEQSRYFDELTNLLTKSL